MRRESGPVTVYAVTPVPFTLSPLPRSMNVRWPHSPLFFIPPATAKFARAPDSVPVIQPPPVTKSPAGGVHAPPLTVSPVISELPAALAPPAPSQVATAWDRRRTAWMELPAAVRFTPATDAAELLRLP